MKLYIGNKNYSSWSMRPWVLMKQFGIAFDEVMLRFDAFDADSAFKRGIAEVSPVGRVPVLVDDAGVAVWDTLAITETLAERFAQHALWPRDAAQRARARSLCAEMHAGFAALRRHCPQNLEASLPEVGVRVLEAQADVRADLALLLRLWGTQLDASGGPFLFGAFSAADAYYAPVCGRIRTYALPVPSAIDAYVDSVMNCTGVAAWVREALTEHDFVAFDEPYRHSR